MQITKPISNHEFHKWTLQTTQWSRICDSPKLEILMWTLVLEGGAKNADLRN
jgi:hypothetical protein